MSCIVKTHLEKRHEEKKLKRKMDAFKSCLKRLDPPITLKSKWEEIAARVSHKSDYRELEEEDRISVFNKILTKMAGKESSSSLKESSDRDKKRHKSSRRRSRSLESSTSLEEEKRRRKRDKREEDSVMKDRIVIEKHSNPDVTYSTEEGEIME